MTTGRTGASEAGPGHRLMRVRLRDVALAVLLVFGPFQYLNFSGFCYDQFRYLGDGEMVAKALDAHRLDPTVSGDKVERALGMVLTMDSDCCVVHRWGHWSVPQGPWVRMFGWYIAVVEIWQTRTSANGEQHPYLTAVSLNACGRTKAIFNTTEILARRRT